MAPGAAVTLVMCLACTGVSAFELATAVQILLHRRKEKAGSKRVGRKSFADFFARAPFANSLHVAFSNKRRAEALRACMPDALRLMSSALSSGCSLVQALEYAARHSDDPLKSELERAVWDLGAGRSFSEAMEGLRSRTGGSGFAYLAVAMEIQHLSGGSLHTTIAAVSESLRQSAELEDELKAKTAQGRLSARIVSVAPVVLLALLSVFSHDYITAFFSSAFGVTLFVLALMLEALGVVMVKKTLAVDVAAQVGEV